ncbi:MAG: hypothetical protein CMN87_02260 [Stappia sp.]|nr:hypothetical protein [Stappia sp.]MBM18812.1 hypothetical protein [Stappia sp.]
MTLPAGASGGDASQAPAIRFGPLSGFFGHFARMTGFRLMARRHFVSASRSRIVPMSVPLAMALLSATAITPASAQVLTSTQSKTHDVSKEGGFVHDPGELVYSFKTSKGDGADAGGSGTACRHFDKPWPDGAGPHSTCGYTGHAASTPDSISSVFIDIDKAQPALKGSSDADHPYGGPLVLVRSRGGNGGAGSEGYDPDFRDGYGGLGGAGARAGTIEFSIGINNKIDVSSYGHSAMVFLAVSGNGGDGGDGSALNGGGHGGNAVGGANGSAVTVELYGGGSVHATGTGKKVAAIHVASKAGDGGDGGDGLASLGSGSGGNGGSGGVGGAVSLTIGKADVASSALDISTTGDKASGVVLQSHGGIGGSGGEGGAIWGGSDGGDGIGDGHGGTVNLAFHGGSITTNGKDSDGILAQSVGGFGGDGGQDDGIFAAYGGDAGKGGNGGHVGLTLDGTTVTTHGEHSIGILAQSVGGAGGRAGSGDGIVGIGGTGGQGGNGGSVELSLKNVTVNTSGAHSDAVSLQSVGGGGGTGGSSESIAAEFVHVVGAAGGTGGDGGDVTSHGTTGLSVVTEGFRSRGILLQSVGGGGGSSGNTLNVAIGLDFNSSLGSIAAAGGGNGGKVDATIDGQIETKGDGAAGVLAQSVGGGGGSAGNTVEASVGFTFNHNIGTNGGFGGDGGTVTLDNHAAIQTDGNDSDGILAQSVAGGGGQSSNVVNASVGVDMGQYISTQGAIGGVGGDAGTVNISSTGAITTKGILSHGILAQSVAGGGGKSGYTVDGAIGINVASSLGQTGGVGGTGGQVKVVNKGKIRTGGQQSFGILAQSLGGGGGNGGVTVNGNIGAEINYTHGSNGGIGGQGGDVSVENDGEIETTGDGATGILAQSLGGGGGAGGVTANGALSILNIAIGVGGNGGSGGSSGTATVTNMGKVTTKGNFATGIFVSSAGGAGGSAGLLAQGTGAGGPITGTISVAVGGSGGTGGTADKASVTNSGAITTAGYAATGIYAQSVGGNGGSGGAVFAGTIDVSSEGAGTVNVTVGGAGGDGGKGGKVEVENHGTIVTTGHYADAIFAQSVGGNGGSGGLSYGGTLSVGTGANISSNVEVGGEGGGSAVGGDVTVTNTEMLATSGGNAHGIFAQSIGGNGGDGGAGYAFLGDFAREKENYVKVTANSQVGGSGGEGQHAGKVSIDNSGQITTVQDTSYGIYAQSVGGGGGDGGNAGAYSIGYTMTPKNEEGEAAEAKGISLSYTMGGSGEGGGDGNDVVVTSSKGGIKTQGVASYGVFAQSVGGGGGTGGNGEPDLKGWVADVYDVYERLNSVKEVYEQVKEFPKSLIEGFSVNVGGSAGVGGHGGTVTVTNDSYIETYGDSATGIYAQSVGGGGGSGGDGSGGLLMSVTVAGNAKGGGHGGTVNVSSTNTIYTEGDGALGIFAQSVGGGGGAAGDLETTIVKSFDDLWETLGAQAVPVDDGGDGGDGGDVTIKVAGGIITSGKAAHGIHAQSVGGGGGAEGELIVNDIDDNPGYIGSEGRKGNGGLVSVTVNSDVVNVSGEGAVGIFAQSAAGSGDSYSKGVAITVKGGAKVRAEGKDGRAILAQASSYNKDHDPEGKNPGEGVVDIEIAKDALVETTSADAHETIAIMGGRTVMTSDGTAILRSNRIDNEGMLRSASPDAVTVRNDDEASLVINTWGGGTFSGSTDLSSSHANTFWIGDDGTGLLGTQMNLGTHAHTTFENSGTVNPGLRNKAYISTITAPTASFESTSIYEVDAYKNESGVVYSDSIHLKSGSGSPGTYSLDGTVDVNWYGKNDLVSGDHGSLLVMQAVNGEDIDTTATMADNGLITYALRGGTGSATNNEIHVDYDVDYSGAKASLGRNASNFLSFFDAAMTRIREDNLTGDSAGSLQELASHLLNSGSVGDLEKRIRSVTSEESLSGASAAVNASQALHRLLQSCPTLDPETGREFFRQRDCVWMQAIGNRHHQSATGSTNAFREVTTGVAGAIQKEVFDDTFIEVGGQVEFLDVTSAGFGQSGTRISGGVALKHEIGAFTLSTTLGGGTYDLDQTRRYVVGATAHAASADVKGRYLTAEGRVSAVFERHGFYAKPSVALSLTQLWQDAFRESGSGPINWNVGSVSKTSVIVTPGLEVGHAFDLADRPTVAFLRAALATELTDPSVTTTQVLAGASASLGGLSSTSSSDRTRATFSAGFDMDVSERFSVSLLGQAGLSENTTDIGGYARAKLRF